MAIYLIWKRSLSLRFILMAATVFVAAALLVNLYPSHDPHDTAVLIAVHLPIALLLLIGILYGGPGWRKAGTRLDFVRFAGEVFIYSVLLGLGGAVLIGVSVGVFQFVEIDIESFIVNWVVVFGGCALLVVAAYLVERKKGRIETIAPVLARIFTPLLLVVLVSLLLAILITGRAPSEDRELLIWFDLLLALVLGMTLYTHERARRRGADRSLGCDGTRPHRRCPRGRRGRPVRHHLPPRRVRCHPQQARRPGGEHPAPGQSGAPGDRVRALRLRATDDTRRSSTCRCATCPPTPSGPPLS